MRESCIYICTAIYIYIPQRLVAKIHKAKALTPLTDNTTYKAAAVVSINVWMPQPKGIALDSGLFIYVYS